jgi:signal transduction histidine kinase
VRGISAATQKKARERAVVDAVDRLQQRIASDLHDGICQELVGIALILDAVLTRVTPDAAAEIRSASAHVRRVATDARRLALGLPPLAVEHAGLGGALTALKFDIQTRKGPTIVVAVDEHVARALPLDVAVNLYRIAQEATANALQHSGASRIDISLELANAGLLFVIQDDGCGIPADAMQQSGLGIRSMISRAKWLGGGLSLLPNAPQGTRIQVILPKPASNGGDMLRVN